MYEMKDGRIWERWERQVMPGTPFEKVPDSWVCPRCEATRDHFEKIDKSVSA